MWPNWFHSFRKPTSNKKRKSKRGTNRLKAEFLEDRSMMATISGYVWDDLNSNGIRDTTQITFQGTTPVVVMMVDVSDTAEGLLSSGPIPGSNVGDVNGDGNANSALDNQLYAYIQLNRKLIASGFGQTGRVILVGYGTDDQIVDFARDDFPDPRDLTVFQQNVKLFATPAEDFNGDGTSDVEQMLRKFRVGFVPQNGPVGNPVDNTTATGPGGFDPNDPLTINFGSPNFLAVDSGGLDYTAAHFDVVARVLLTEPLIPTPSGFSVAALPDHGDQITFINFATQALDNIDFMDVGQANNVPLVKSAGADYFAFGLGVTSLLDRTILLPQLQLLNQNARILNNFAELEAYVFGSRFTEPGVAQAQVYIDANNNARYDTGERIVTTSANIVGTPLDESGNFAFTGLGVGTYIVRQLLPLNFTQTFPSAAFYRVVITAATQTVTNINFSRAPNNTFRGFVFNDANDDGAFTFGERGLANVKVYIDVNKNGRRDANEPTAVTIRDIASTTTFNEAGQYSFTNVAPGTYIIRAEAPTGFAISSPLSTTTAPLGANVVAGGLAWRITLPALRPNGTRISTISGLDFGAVQGARAPIVTTSTGITTFTEGHLPNVHTLVDPSIVIDLRGLATTKGVQLVASIIQGGDFADILSPLTGGGITFTQVGDPSFPQWQILANGVLIGIAEGGRDSSPLVMTFNARASQALIQAVARRIEFINDDPNLSNVDRIVGFQIVLPSGQESNLPVKFIRVITLNSPPVLSDATPNQFVYQAGDAAFQLFNGVTITDSDNPTNYGGGRLTVTLGGESVGVADTLTIQDSPGLLEFVDTDDGKDIYFFNGIDFLLIGSVNAFDPGTSMEIRLTSNATPAIVEFLISQIRFSTSDAVARPAGTTTITLQLIENQIKGASNTIEVVVDVQGAPISALAMAFFESQNTKKR